MDKYIDDENNSLWYEPQGDYYIPCLILSADKEQPVGYVSGRLNAYLTDIDSQTQEYSLLLTKQMADQENVTEQLKADNAVLCVQKMNEIQSRVKEIICNEIIYA